MQAREPCIFVFVKETFSVVLDCFRRNGEREKEKKEQKLMIF